MNLKPIFLILLSFALFSGCKKDKDQESADAEYYLKGKLDNKAINWQVTSKTDYSVATESTTLLGDGVVTGTLTANITKGGERKPNLGVSFKTFNTRLENKELYFNTFVNEGAWNYAASKANTIGEKNIIIRYIDENGKEYTSVGAQEGSTFSVLKVTKYEGSWGSHPNMDIKLKFNCKLYPETGTGNVIVLSDVEAILNLLNLL